ncbi:D-3-Phosphoglycerate Dehydrogenase [Manis pentadactyla]|nr:D-3-Phosphoglycerate Dehydrogenase [Manis pentadactyla]
MELPFQWASRTINKEIENRVKYYVVSSICNHRAGEAGKSPHTKEGIEFCGALQAVLGTASGSPENGVRRGDQWASPCLPHPAVSVMLPTSAPLEEHEGRDAHSPLCTASPAPSLSANNPP